MRRLLRLLLLLSLLAWTQAFVHAQTAAYAEIARIDAADFPQVSALVDVYNADGAFISGLKPGVFTVYEDGQVRPADSLREIEVPVQVVVAVNPGPPLAIRDSNGVARYERVVEALRLWAQAQPGESLDDLSLVSLSGSLINHSNITDWFVSLNSFKPDFRNSTANLQTLAIALDTVNAPTPQPGMKRAVLFITPRMDNPDIADTVAPLIQRAVDSKVRVFVWFIDAEEFHTSPSAEAFQLLARQTGGGFFAFSRAETFPDPASYFAPLRAIYEVKYTSALTTPGEHALGLSVKAQDTEITASDRTFSIDVQPPNPIFVSPPLQITRQPPADDPYNAEALEPSQQPLEIIVEFPDGHPRDIVRTTLYVDGQVAAENTEEPFTAFTWDYSAITESGQHQIVVEAEDALGLKKSSIATPVTFTVILPPGGLEAFTARYRSELVTGSIVFAGLALLGILLRSRVRNIPESRRRKARRAKEDPLTQPVVALTEPPVSATKKAKTQPRFGWMGARPGRIPPAPAYLVRLADGGEPASGAPIPLTEKETTFGTDPVQSIYVLDDPSIAPLHARLKQGADGTYTLLDQGSVAGTWVNFEAVTREGMRLKHGDRIHFGRLSYRFDLGQPPAESEPRVIPQK